jgi:hypothetical protein
VGSGESLALIFANIFMKTGRQAANLEFRPAPLNRSRK